MKSRPKVFISYSWDSEEHKKWVKKLSDDLNNAGIDTILDVKDLNFGDPIPYFMESAISNSDYVLVIMTPEYKQKADRRIGGVGYEDSIITAEVNEMRNHRKFIPVLANGSWAESTPLWAKGKIGIDLSSKSNYDEELSILADRLKGIHHKSRPIAPIVKDKEKAEIDPYVIEADDLVDIIQQDIDDQSGRYCFIVGAGTSISSGIPSAQLLGYRWIKWLEDNNRLKRTERAAAALYKSGKLFHTYNDIMSAYRDGKNNQMLPSDYYFDAYRLRFNRKQREGIMELEQAMENVVPGFSHNIFAQLLSRFGNMCNLVITTNFDSLIEDALFIYTGKKPLVISHEAMAEYADDPFMSRPIIAKIHRGLLFDPLNDPNDMNVLKGKWREILLSIFKYYTPIVIGYGGGDHSLMDLLADDSLEFKKGLYWCSYYDYDIANERIKRMIVDKELRFVRTEGFDSLMLKIGNALLGSDILPSTVSKYLDIQADVWKSKYIDGFYRASDFGSKDSLTLKNTEKEDTAKREKEGKLTKWDYLQLGDDKLYSKDYTGAVEEYTKAIQLDSQYASAYYNRGYAYNCLGDYDNAAKDRLKAIQLQEAAE